LVPEKKPIFHSKICEIADKKTAYNEGCLYLFLLFVKTLYIVPFSDCRFIKNENVALVLFYAPWSKDCKAILPGKAIFY